MKKLMLSLLCLQAVCLNLTATEPPTTNSKDAQLSSNSDTYQSAVVVSVAEMNSLVKAYETAEANSTWGGSFRKSDLQKLLNEMPVGSKFVNFRFGIDPTGATSLMMNGVDGPGDPQPGSICIRNGGSPTAFCPTVCNAEGDIAPEGIVISYEDYLQMSAAYQTANDGKTAGGNIDKSALQEILNSLPADLNWVCFKFCIDPTTKNTSVIFIGGQVGQKNRTTLIYRNGKDVNGFCPTMCNRQ